ncbi:hypothetical protein JCM10213_004297 [Rhodosporidiobolus nylandii]
MPSIPPASKTGFSDAPEFNTGGYKKIIEQFPRDVVGYGMEAPGDWLPNGAKIAVSFVLNYEEGAEFTPWNGDDRSNEFLMEEHYHRDALKGRRDVVVEQGFEYGIRCGLPRLLRLFDRFGWKFTTWACARSFEVTGFYPKLLAEKGHEIACHGNRWRKTNDMTGPDEEAEHIRKSFKRLQDSTGRKDVPTAFFTGNGSLYHAHMRARIHKELDIPLRYNSDSYSGDLPYWIPSPLALDGDVDSGMLMLPYTLTLNDHRFLVKGATGTGSARDWTDLLIGEFETLYAEGQAGHPKMMTVAMHNRVLGKPARAMALRRFMEHIATKPDVWIATREQIAAAWQEKFPYSEVGPTRDLHAK